MGRLLSTSLFIIINEIISKSSVIPSSMHLSVVCSYTCLITCGETVDTFMFEVKGN